MAISKEQPMRPALEDCIDGIDQTNLDLSSEILNRQNGDAAVTQLVNEVKDVLPYSEFDALHTIKQYIDNADSAIKEVIPFAGFDSINTVEKYIDSLGNTIKGIIPFSSFDSTNTVKKYIDDLSTAIKEVIPFADFDSTNTVKKYIDDKETDIVALYRYGKYSATIAANDSDAQSITYSSAFGSGKSVMLLTQLDDTYSDLTVTVSNESLTGFDISIVNSGASSITFTFIYFAIGV